MKKRAAMEMSMGTIVTIVLSVTLLIAGVIFIRNLIVVQKGVIDLTDAQLRDEINKLFSTDSRLVIYPQTRFVQIKQETTDGVGIGIKNLLQGSGGDTTFSYVVLATDVSDCGITEEEAEEWIITGKQENDIPIASGALMTDKIIFRIPVGAPLCIAKFRVNVDINGDAYATDSFNIEVKAK